jgi:Helix-turn-helix domain
VFPAIRGAADCQKAPESDRKLFAARRSQAEVAHQIGVSRQNVSRWHARWRSGGSEALRSRLMTWIGVSIENPAQHVRSDHDPGRDLEHD